MPFCSILLSLSVCGACRQENTKFACSSAKSQRQCAATRTSSKHDAPRNRFLHPAQPPVPRRPLRASVISMHYPSYS